MNKPEFGVRKTNRNCSSRDIHGIAIWRYGASWLNAGGNLHDSDGFLTWMMNIPFKNSKGEIEYISQDDAEDAYTMMHMGKFELECAVRDFLKDWKPKPRRGDCWK